MKNINATSWKELNIDLLDTVVEKLLHGIPLEEKNKDHALSGKTIEKASTHARNLEKEYNASVVWMGGNKFIVVKNGKEIIVEV